MTRKHNSVGNCIRERDIAILWQLHEKVSLTIGHIHRLCFQRLSRDSVYKNMTKLKRLGLVTTQTYDLGQKGKLEDLYFISRKGFNTLMKFGLIEDIERYKYKKAPNLIVDYLHRIGIVDYWILVEQQFVVDQVFNLKLFVPQYKPLQNGKLITLKAELDDGRTLTVRNDAIYIISEIATGLEYLYLLEVDRKTTPRTMNDKLKQDLQSNIEIRDNLEHKFQKIEKLNFCGQRTFAQLGGRFEHFCGARVVVYFSSI